MTTNDEALSAATILHKFCEESLKALSESLSNFDDADMLNGLLTSYVQYSTLKHAIEVLAPSLKEQQ